jgi:hypothetical protein
MTELFVQDLSRHASSVARGSSSTCSTAMAREHQGIRQPPPALQLQRRVKLQAQAEVAEVICALLQNCSSTAAATPAAGCPHGATLNSYKATASRAA